jgi:4-amino-4-deoxy-L-arabinose transferase-like glycosyltransferase
MLDALDSSSGDLPEQGRRQRRRVTAMQVARAALLMVSAILYGLHFIHLSADFPNHSPWMDWSKYTDEGWYGDAAIRQLQLGHWYVRGDFNPAVALPVWPLLEFAVFSVTGVSLIAARALTVAVFGAILVAVYLLVRRFAVGGQNGNARASGTLVPALAVAMLAASPFCYVFTRLAILEPLLILLMLLALLAASRSPGSGRRWMTPLALGVLIPLMVLTKTTAVFLLPSVAWMLWASGGYRLRPLLRTGLPAAAIGAALWSAYYALLVRPRFLEDYRYLFSANAYTGITRENAFKVIAETFRDGMWMGELIFPAALIAAGISLVLFRRFFTNPLVPVLLLWAGGYAAFLAYHNNLQPRYYLVVAVPLTVLVPVVAGMAWESLPWSIRPRSLAATPAAMAFLVLLASDSARTFQYIAHREYTYAQAAQNVRGVVLADPGHSPLVLSISGSDLSLMTGLPSICDDFGTMTLEDRVKTYRPGWYAAWNEVDDDKMDALSPMFHLERVAEFPAFDDPERNLLILYRLDPPAEEPPHKARRKAVPKLLQTRIGQQPSATQLEH